MHKSGANVITWKCFTKFEQEMHMIYMLRVEIGLMGAKVSFIFAELFLPCLVHFQKINFRKLIEDELSPLLLSLSLSLVIANMDLFVRRGNLLGITWPHLSSSCSIHLKFLLLQ